LTDAASPDILRAQSSGYRNYSGAAMLHIKLQDIQRATLPLNSGNEGWIGVSPAGDDYHVVVPVDRQIARGVMACNRPTDGTPFGGYAGWLYFRCPPYEESDSAGNAEREARVRETAEALLVWLASHKVDACVDIGDGSLESDSRQRSEDGESEAHSKAGGSQTNRGETFLSGGAIACSRCKKRWSHIADFLRDSQIRVGGYRACLDDFARGTYLFSHSCGNTVEVPVSRFARARHRGRSLIGTHACPGLCYYERSLLGCSAACEGAGYRRIAVRLGRRRKADNI
jgi:hypothetical protein